MKKIKNSLLTLHSSTLKKYLNIYKKELFEKVIPFWMKYSPDKKYGGYFTCLDEDGTIYDTKKYIWLQARQAWFFSYLYNRVKPRPEWLTMAELGINFLKKHGKGKEGRVYFSTTREGKPFHLQRKIFSECFYIMAFSEYAKATNDKQLLKQALTILDNVLKWSKDLSLIGRPKLAGIPPSSSLAIPMILLDLVNQIMQSYPEVNYKKIADSCVVEILLHIHHKHKAVLETVSKNGILLDSPEGRLINPGHAIESAWFLLHYKTTDSIIQNTALKIIEWSLERGWDKKYGGLYYFVDLKNQPLLQLEGTMKLWWPHTEALYALLLAYSLTNNKKYWNQFKKVHAYTFSHFPDKKYGEWYGYLDRYGHKTHSLKGGAYKGCFHVPRFLLYSVQLLEKIIDTGHKNPT